MNWFKRRGSNDSDTTTHIPDLPSSIKYNGDHHISYNVARSRLKKAITEFYRSLELLKSYRVRKNTSSFLLVYQMSHIGTEFEWISKDFKKV